MQIKERGIILIPIDFTIKTGDTSASDSSDDDHYSKITDLAEKGITDVEQILDSLGKEKTFWNKLYYSQVIKTINLNGDEFQHYVKSKLAWMVFAVMPVFALLLMAFFYKSKYFYIDHLMFSCHLHSFIFLMSCISVLIEMITGWGLATAATLTVAGGVAATFTLSSSVSITTP